METDNLNLYTCLSCGWAHFGVTREFAENEVTLFNIYFNDLDPQEQKDHYGGKGASIKNYDSCGCCGGSYKNFRKSLPGDCPDGCTIGPIIVEE